MPAKVQSLFDPQIIGRAALNSLKKLNPVSLMKNPVIFVTEVGALLTTLGLVLRKGPEEHIYRPVSSSR